MKTLKEIRMKKRLKRLVKNWMRNHNMKKKYSYISPKKEISYRICVIEKDTNKLYTLTAKYFNPLSKEKTYDNIEIDLCIMEKEGRTSYAYGNHEKYYISECSERVIHL